MKPISSRFGVVGLSLVALLASTPAVLAKPINFSADLKASNEVPPVRGNGTGKLAAIYDDATKNLTWTVEYSGLTANPVAAHFHGPASPGANAGIVVPLTGNYASPMKGTATLTDAQAADLLAEKWYLNIHTAANPGGEIRGQVMKAK